MELTYKVKIEIDNYSYDFEVITPIEKDEANLNAVIDDQILENLYNEISFSCNWNNYASNYFFILSLQKADNYK